MKILKVPPDDKKNPKDEVGVLSLRDRLLGKRGNKLAKILREYEAWPWAKTNIKIWVEILNVFDAHLKEASTGKLSDSVTIAILSFTELLITNSYDPGMYNSHEHLLSLLDHENSDVVIRVLMLFDNMFKHTGCRNNSNLDHEIYKAKIFALATGFCIPNSTNSLRQMSSKSTGKAEIIAMKNQLRLTFPSDKDAKETVIDLSNLSRDVTLSKVLGKKKLSKRFHFSLKHHVQFAKSFAVEEKRQMYIRIKLVSIRLAMCFSWTKKEFLQKHFKSNPHLTEMLLDLLQNSHQIPLPVTITALHCLKSLTQVPYVESRMRDLGVLTDGIIPSLLHQCITRLKSDPDSPRDLLLTEAILSFIQKLSSENIVYAYPRAFRPTDVMDWMMSILSNFSISCAMVLMRALRIVEKLIAPNRDVGSLGASTGASRSRFHQANGFDLCLNRLKQLYVNPPAERKLLSFVLPGKMQIIPANHLLGKCVKALLRVSSISARHHRRPVRSTMLKDGVFASVIIKLWQLSQSEEKKEPIPKPKSSPKPQLRARRRRKCATYESKSSSSKVDMKMMSLKNSSIVDRRQDPRKIHGDKIFALSCALLCNVIQNRPSCLKSLHESGVTRAFLDTLNPDMLRTEAIFKTVPETIRSLCLNSDGLKMVLKKNPLQMLFNLVSSAKKTHLAMLTPPTIYFLGRSVEELFRHFPAFLNPGIKSCKAMLAALADKSGDIIDSKDREKRVANVAQLLSTLMRHFGKKFVEVGEVEMIPRAVQKLYAKEIDRSSMRDVGADLVQPMITMANQDPAKVTKSILSMCIEILDSVLQSESFKKQEYFSWRSYEKENQVLVHEVQEMAQISWCLSVLLKLSRRSLLMMLKNASFKAFVNKISRVVCLCKWSVTRSLLENNTLMIMSKKGGTGVENKDKKVSEEVLEKFTAYRDCSKNVLLYTGKLMRFLAKSTRSSRGNESIEMFDQLIHLYLDFKPARLKAWRRLLLFTKGTIKLSSSLLVANSRYTGFNNNAFSAFCRRGGTDKIVKLLKWLVNTPPFKPGGSESARLEHFRKNPWGIERDLPITPKTMGAIQTLLDEIGTFISFLSDYAPKSPICLALIKNGMKNLHPNVHPHFCDSVLNTARKVLVASTEEIKKKQHSEEDLAKLVNMGFGRARSLHALRIHRFRFVRAMEWLLANPDDSNATTMDVDEGDFENSIGTLDSNSFIKSVMRIVKMRLADKKVMDKIVRSAASLFVILCKLDDKEEKSTKDDKGGKIPQKEESKNERSSSSENKLVGGKTSDSSKRRPHILQMIMDYLVKNGVDAPNLKSPKGTQKARSKSSKDRNQTKTESQEHVKVTELEDVHNFVYLLSIMLHKDAKFRKLALTIGVFPSLITYARKVSEVVKSPQLLNCKVPSTPGLKRKRKNSSSDVPKRKSMRVTRSGKKLAPQMEIQLPSKNVKLDEISNADTSDVSRRGSAESCLSAFLCGFNVLVDPASKILWNTEKNLTDSSSSSKKAGKSEVKAIIPDAETEIKRSQLDSLLTFCVSLLQLPIVSALPPLLELIAKLTKSHRNAIYFVKKGGVTNLLQIRSMPRLEDRLTAICHTVMRHVVEHPLALQHGMEKEIFFHLLDATKQEGKKVKVQDVVLKLAVMIRRDPHIFRKALQSVATFELGDPMAEVKLKANKMRRNFELKEKDNFFLNQFIGTLLHAIMIENKDTKSQKNMPSSSKPLSKNEKKNRIKTTDLPSSSAMILDEKKESNSDLKSEEVSAAVIFPSSFSERGLGYAPLITQKSLLQFLRNLVEMYDQIAAGIVHFRSSLKKKSGKEEAKSSDFIDFAVDKLSTESSLPPVSSVSALSAILMTVSFKSPHVAGSRVVESIVNRLQKSKKSNSVNKLLTLLKTLLLRPQFKRSYAKSMIKASIMDALCNLLEWMNTEEDRGSTTLRTFYRVLEYLIREDQEKSIDPSSKLEKNKSLEWIGENDRFAVPNRMARRNPFAQVLGSSRFLDEIRRRTGRRRGGVQVVVHNPLVQFGEGLIRFNLIQQNDQDDEERLEDEFGHGDIVMVDDLEGATEDDEEEDDEGMLIQEGDIMVDEDDDEDIGEEDEEHGDVDDIEDEMSEVLNEDDEEVHSDEGVEIEGHVFGDDIEGAGVSLGTIEISDEPIVGEEDEVDEDEAREILQAAEESKIEMEGSMDDDDEDDEDDDEDVDEDDAEDDMDEENSDIDIVIDDNVDSMIDAVIQESKEQEMDSDLLPSADIQPFNYSQENKDATIARMPEYFRSIFEAKQSISNSRGRTFHQRWHEVGNPETVPMHRLQELIEIVCGPKKEKKKSMEKQSSKTKKGGPKKRRKKTTEPTENKASRQSETRITSASSSTEVKSVTSELKSTAGIENRNSSRTTGARSATDSNTDVKIDLAFLAALPPEIQAELLSTQSLHVEASRRHGTQESSQDEGASTNASSSSEQKDAAGEEKVDTARGNMELEGKGTSNDDGKNGSLIDSKAVRVASTDEKVLSPPDEVKITPASSSSEVKTTSRVQTASSEEKSSSSRTVPVDSKVPSSLQHEVDSEAPDPAFLDAMPPDIRAELIAQHEAASRRRAEQVRAQEMDQASVLATFDPRLRREWLMQQDESVLASLPSSILAEGVMLRHRASRPYFFQPRRSTFRNPSNDSSRDTGRKEKKTVDKKMWIGHVRKPILPVPLVQLLVYRLCIFRFLEVTMYNRVLSAVSGYKDSRAVLLHIFMIMLNFMIIDRNLRQKGKKSKKNSGDLHVANTWNSLYNFVSGLPTRMIGDEAPNFSNSMQFPAPLLVARILQVMTHLMVHRPQMLLHFFFKDSSKDITFLFKSSERNCKNWIEQMFALYSSSPFSWSAKHMEILTQFLFELLSVRDKLRVKPPKESKESKERKDGKPHRSNEAKKPENSSSAEGDMKVAEEDSKIKRSSRASKKEKRGEKTSKSELKEDNQSEKGKRAKSASKAEMKESNQWASCLIPLDMPAIDSKHLMGFVHAFQRENCAEKVFTMAMKIARYLAEVDGNKQGLLKEIGKTTKNLTIEITADLQNCITSMSSFNSKLEADFLTMKFGGSLYKLSGRQARLLRLLSFLDSLGVLKNSNENVSSSSKDKGCPAEIEKIIPSMDLLWETLNQYLLKLVPPKASDSKTAPQRNTKQKATKEESESSKSNNAGKRGTKRHADSTPKFKTPKGKGESTSSKQTRSTPRSSQRSSRRARRASSDAKRQVPPPSSSVDIEDDDSDVSQLLQLLPLIESYFIVNSPKTPEEINSESSKKFLEFTHTHSRILNIFCQKKPVLMHRTLKSLLWHPKKILNFNNKHSHFLAEIRKQRAASGSMGNFRLLVRRKRLFEDSYHQFQTLKNEELKAPISVKFHAEAGVDAGGLTREWFLLLSRAIFDPNYCLFTAAADNNNVFQPSKASHVNPDHLLFFRFVGRFVGKAIYDGQLLDAYFTRSFYKHMLGVKPSVSDVESIDPEYYKSLKWILNNSIEGILDLNFTREGEEFGVKKVVELKKNGSNFVVTDKNKNEYVQLMAERMLTDDIKKQIDAFLRGFREIIDVKLLSIFNEQELELLICGLPDIDINDLKANTEYKGLSSSCELVRWFWNVVDDMSQEEKALLVQFVTGTSKVPIQGFKELQGMNGKQRFQIHKASGVDRLPTAHTCFNQLDLPSYSSLKSMRKNLLLAIREGSEGFAFR